MRVLLLFSMLLVAACARDAGPRVTASVVDEIAERHLREETLVGFVVAVAEDGNLVFEKGYGLRDVATKEPMTPDAVLDYFSVGKHMAAAIILRLTERRLVELDAPVNVLLPQADFEDASITLRQLLTHSSGLSDPVIDDANPPLRLVEPPPADGALAMAGESGRIGAPGETWWYSNAGYLFAGLAAETAAGQSLEVLIANELAGPLRLERFSHCAEVRQDLSPAYHRFEGKPRTFPLIDVHWYGAAGAVCGTGRDLLRWWLALQGGRVVTKASLEEMQTPVVIKRNGVPGRFGYGLGLRLGEFGGHRKTGHTGSAAGGTSVLAEYPEAGLVIAVITNTGGDGATDARTIEAELAAALLDVDRESEPEEPLPHGLEMAAPGLYRSLYTDALCVTYKGRALHRSIDAERPETLRHTGNGRFGEPDGTFVEYFIGAESGRAEWFALDVLGFPEDLGMRIADSCG